MRARSIPRRGFTVTELLVVLVVMLVILGLAAPRLSALRARNNLAAAKQQIAQALSVARASAIHRGQTIAFTRAGNVVGVRNLSTSTNLVEPMDLERAFNVSIAADGTTPDTIRFDSRGFRVGAGTDARYVVTRSAELVDTVCVRGSVVRIAGCI